RPSSAAPSTTAASSYPSFEDSTLLSTITTSRWTIDSATSYPRSSAVVAGAPWPLRVCSWAVFSWAAPMMLGGYIGGANEVLRWCSCRPHND
ncbi:hypothetical protein PIB30_088441, partial [Stylosanthes scabra]|nr:hypothetical protein [Stylosanthes scabra]